MEKLPQSESEYPSIPINSGMSFITNVTSFLMMNWYIDEIPGLPLICNISVIENHERYLGLKESTVTSVRLSRCFLSVFIYVTIFFQSTVLTTSDLIVK